MRNSHDPVYKSMFEELYRMYHPRMIRYFIRRTANIQTAEELSQDIFARIFSKSIFLEPGKAYTRAYLYKSARNRLIDYFRRNSASARTIHLECIEEADKSINMEDAIIEGELVETLNAILDELPPEERKQYLMRMLKIRGKNQLSQSEYRRRYLMTREVNCRITDLLASYRE
jgi:RNA polymerase sigma factor (sigma-70 family)